MPQWLLVVLGLIAAVFVIVLCYELITNGTKHQQSGCVWLIILALGFALYAIGGLLLSVFASVLASSWGPWIIAVVFLAMGWFGFFYKPRKK